MFGVCSHPLSPSGNPDWVAASIWRSVLCAPHLGGLASVMSNPRYVLSMDHII